ncbi:MAG: hypothetical protein JWQ04_3029 [Pedosphaera sp.]|nr:hypothetical protein [Pedosphaera sp.]
MNESTTHPEDDLANASREDILAALFANMVIQQTNMTMMLLGKVAHPDTGKIVRDIDAARMFIDQLEMLEAKTKGNLSKQEEGLLKQALAAVHMAFVEAVDSGGSAGAGEAPTGRIATPQTEPPPAHEAPAEAAGKSFTASPEAPAAASPDESRKKFSKKY